MKELIDKDGWVRCPDCGKKTRIKVLKDTVLIKFPLYCPKCGNETIINVDKNELYSIEPDAKTQSR